MEQAEPVSCSDDEVEVVENQNPRGRKPSFVRSLFSFEGKEVGKCRRKAAACNHCTFTCSGVLKTLEQHALECNDTEIVGVATVVVRIWS